MLEARSIAAVHQQGSKAQQGVVFDTVNLVRKMCSFAEPKEGYSQVNKDDNEVEAFRPENTTWDPFLLGKSCVQIQHSREEKSQWSYCLNQGTYQWRKSVHNTAQPRERSLYPLHSHLPARLKTIRSYTDWSPEGSWFYHQEGKIHGVLLGKKAPGKDHNGLIRHKAGDGIQGVTC